MGNCCEGIQVGQAAPGFSAKGVSGGAIVDIAFEDGKLTVDGQGAGGKYTVLFFYPLDFTFVCPTEIIAFSEAVEKFVGVNAQVVGVSIDSHYTHLAWTQTPRAEGGLGDISYPLVSDLNHCIAQKYGVLLPDGIAARGVFIIDGDGVLQSYTVNNLGVGRNVDECIRLIQGFQFVAEHGEVCPANWTPGADTMKPDPNGALEYFEKAN